MRALIQQDWQSRPWWMTLIFYFCAYMALIYMPFDIFLKPVADDQEVWFGFLLTGWWAKATAPLHWVIYGLLAYGFYKRKRWMWPWAAIYAMQVVIAMFLWNILQPNGAGWLGGLIAAGVFAIPAIALWRSRSFFHKKAT